MNRDRISRRRRSTEVDKRNQPSSTEDSSPVDSFENSPHIKSTSTPLKNKWSSQQDINRSPENSDDRLEMKHSEESSGDENRDRFSTLKKRGSRENREHVPARRKEKRRGKRRRAGRSQESRKEIPQSEEKKEASESQSSSRRYSESDVVDETKKKYSSRGGEVPITEILKRAQENVRTKYETPIPLPELTTNKIYIQGRNGFSAMKIDRLRGARGKDGMKRTESRRCPPIRAAVVAQKFWKCTGLVYQGILGGMALMHFLMLQVFFQTSMEFIVNYSTISEIYTNIFSFLIALCIVSTFDKFDLARFDVDHLREIYADYSKTVLAIPLYLATFCLHQVSARTDNQLALVHYYNLNDSVWENDTNIEAVLNELSSWQKMSVAKDLLAVFAWLFVSLGTRDDAFLIHLESMEKYANPIESPGQ